MSHDVDPFALQSDRVGESVLKQIIHLLLHELRKRNSLEFAILRKNISVGEFIKEWLGCSTFADAPSKFTILLPGFSIIVADRLFPLPFLRWFAGVFLICFCCWTDRRFDAR